MAVHIVHCSTIAQVRTGAHLELAALDQLEGEDCGSLLSKSMTHGRHAARCNAANILHRDSKS